MSSLCLRAELQDVYHGTVGHNSFLMMDYAPTPEGLIAPDQVARCKHSLSQHLCDVC